MSEANVAAPTVLQAVLKVHTQINENYYLDYELTRILFFIFLKIYILC